MTRKIMALIVVLSLASLLIVQESFAYPQYGSSCSSCHGINTAQNMAGSTIGVSTPRGNKNEELGYNISPAKYALGVIGTGLIAISQFYSIRKRSR